jgi:hypothetical protein
MARPNRRRIGPLLVAPDGRTPLTAVMWRCSKCRETKPETDFSLTDASGRRRASCKACEAIRQAALRTRERRASGVLRGSAASDLRSSVSVRVQGSARLHFAPDGLDSCSISQLVGGA